MKNKTNISWQGFTRYPSVLALMLWFGQANAIEITDIYDTDFYLNIDNPILEYRHDLADDLEADDIINSAKISIAFGLVEGSDTLDIQIGEASYTSTNINPSTKVFAVTTSHETLQGDKFLDVQLIYRVVSLNARNQELLFDSSTLTAEVIRTVQTTNTEGGTGGVLVTPSQIPEPTTLALFGLGLAGLGFTRRRMKA
jgi:hypothetical protein